MCIRDRKQFLRILERQGYAFRFDRKHPTLILPGSGRTVRFKTLGMRYTPETLQRRILYPKPAHWAGKEQTPVRRRLLLSGKKPHRRRTGLRALYFSYLYKVGALPKKPRYISYAVREDIRKMCIRDRHGNERIRLLWKDSLARDPYPLGKEADIIHKPKGILKKPSLGARLKANRCEWCGKETSALVMHQVRTLKELDESQPWARCV